MPIRAANKAQQSVRAESARHALHMILSYIGAQETREPGQSREHEGARNGEDGHADREDDGLMIQVMPVCSVTIVPIILGWKDQFLSMVRLIPASK